MVSLPPSAVPPVLNPGSNPMTRQELRHYNLVTKLSGMKRYAGYRMNELGRHATRILRDRDMSMESDYEAIKGL